MSGVFMECDLCIAKLGTPQLCRGCLHNRALIGKLRELNEIKVSSNVAMKFDDNKIRWDLLPPRALEAVADILTYGANKYAEHNWRKGMKWSRLFGAMCRHMWAFWRGEEIDPESGKYHLAHAACNVLMLLEYFLEKEGEDDRYEKTK